MVRTRHRRRRTPSARALEVLACQPPHAPPPAKQPARSTPNSQLQARRRAARARAERDPYTRARNAVRAAVNKLRNDATLIEAYGGGWSGAARERGARVRPVEQLEAAKAREGELKLTVRQAMRVMHESGGDVRIPAEAYDSDGELDEEHIICSKCGSGECEDGNDIILCDGECDRCYHMNCVSPPLLAEDVPEGDEGWLCPACDAWVDCVWIINQYEGEWGSGQSESWTPLHTGSHWQDVFPEAEAEAAAAGCAAAAAAAEDGLLPSEDEEDDDWCDADGGSACASEGSDGSSSGSEVEGVEESGVEESDSEVEEVPLTPVASLARSSRRARGTAGGAGPSGAPGSRSRRRGVGGGRDSDQEGADAGGDDSGSSSADDSPAQLIIKTKRRRTKVDYLVLNAQMFGSGEAYRGELLSEISGGDDEWCGSPGPTSRAPAEAAKIKPGRCGRMSAPGSAVRGKVKGSAVRRGAKGDAKAKAKAKPAPGKGGKVAKKRASSTRKR